MGRNLGVSPPQGKHKKQTNPTPVTTLTSHLKAQVGVALLLYAQEAPLQVARRTRHASASGLGNSWNPSPGRGKRVARREQSLPGTLGSLQSRGREKSAGVGAIVHGKRGLRVCDRREVGDVCS